MNNVINTEQSILEKWFDEFVAIIRTHEIELQTDTANQKLKEFYSLIFSGDTDKIAHSGKQIAQQHFVRKMIVEYLLSIKEAKVSKVAFSFNDSEVLTWVEIEDNDERSEYVLFSAEAKINSKYHNYGFDMETTIVEKGDNLNIPNHYKIFKDNEPNSASI